MEGITAESILSGKPTSKQDFPIRAVKDHHVDRLGVEAW
jgi:hypothetical protein